jgi:hypothetical protein
MVKKVKEHQKLNKKSQTEIIGITIVMVLIMLGIIFVIRFVVLSDNYNIKQEFDKSQMAANFMDAVLKTTTSCNQLTITELIMNCAEFYGNTNQLYNCPSDTALGICPGGCRSCDFLNQSLEYILNNSLNQMPQVNYEMYICRWNPANAECNTGVGDIISSFQHANCRNATRFPIGYTQKQQPIPTNVGNRVLQMYIC